jgi:hypothetical protein
MNAGPMNPRNGSGRWTTSKRRPSRKRRTVSPINGFRLTRAASPGERDRIVEPTWWV